MRTIAIDPGKSGGIAHCDGIGDIRALPMPGTDGELLDLLRSLRASGIECAVVEEVVGFIPSAGAGAMFTFGKGFGFLLGCLMALNFRIELVRPQKWQSAMSLGKKSEHGKNWKKHLLQKAQQLFPNADVTLKTADALLLLEYQARHGHTT